MNQWAIFLYGLLGQSELNQKTKDYKPTYFKIEFFISIMIPTEIKDKIFLYLSWEELENSREIQSPYY